MGKKNKKKSFEMLHNERFDEGYAKNWGIAVISSKNKGYIQAFATDPNGMQSFTLTVVHFTSKKCL